MGLVANMGFVEILEVLGKLCSTRYMTLLLLTLAVVEFLERNGLREEQQNVSL